MAATLNKVMLIGRLGRDPELRYTQNGTAVATLNMATDESYTDRDGNRVDRAEWHRVVVWSRQAENCAQYLSKGSLAFVEGSLQTRQWQDQQGQTRYSTEVKAQRVQFLDTRSAAPDQRDSGYGNKQQNQNQGGGGYQDYGPQGPGPETDDDMGPAFPSEAGGMDEVPF